MDAIAEPALEPIAVEQGHEELEILFLAVVRCRRHEQQVPADLAEFLAHLIAPRIFNLAAEIGGRHAVGFVADDQIPFARAHELLLKLLVARQHVEADDQPIPVAERIARPRVLDHVAGEDVELEIELLAEFVLPLLNQAARRDDEAAFEIAAGDQLLHQQPGHDRLAGAGIVGEEEAKRLPRQHLAIDRRNLVRQRIDQTRVDRQIRVEIMRQLDAVGFRHEAQQCAIGVERPWPPVLLDLETVLVVPVENGLGHRAVVIAVNDVDRLIADPVHRNDMHGLRRGDTPHGCAVLYLFKPCRHQSVPPTLS